jgi:hypothetical protein
MSAVQTLKLDARQRAMLDEMGVKVWWPVPEAVEVAEAAPSRLSARPAEERWPTSASRLKCRSPRRGLQRRSSARPSVSAAPASRPPHRSPPPAPPPPADPRRLRAGRSALPPLCRRHPLDVQGGWLVVADMPPEADGRHGEPFSGDAGRLLDNMLRALKLHDGKTPVHLMRTHRGVAAGQPGSPRPMDEAFGEHAAALAPRVVLAMGPLAAQSLMQSGDPLGKLRGRAVPLAGADTGAGGVPRWWPRTTPRTCCATRPTRRAPGPTCAWPRNSTTPADRLKQRLKQLRAGGPA